MKRLKSLIFSVLMVLLGSILFFCDGSEYLYPENELSDLYEKYLSCFNPNGGIMLQDWNEAGEIEASELVQFCAYNNFCNLPTDPPDGLISQGAMYVNGTAPAASVEKAVIQFFDVQNDYLKTAPEYDAASDTYLQPFGYGGSGMLSLTSARKKGNTLILSTRVESAANTHYIEGELEIKLGNEDSFKYISYTIQDRG